MSDIFEVTEVREAVWGNAEQTEIRCVVVFPNLAHVPDADKGIPFNAMASDTTDHGQQIFADLSSGKYGKISAYVAPAAPAVTPIPASSK